MRAWMYGWVVVALLGCDEKDEASTAAVAASASSAAASVAPEPAPKRSAEAAPPDPCTILTSELLRKHLDVPADVALEPRRSKHSPHPHCSYSWSTLSEEEQRKEQAEMVRRMTTNMKKGKIAGGLLDVAHMGREEAHLTLVKTPFESPKAAQERLASIRKMMERGIKRQVQSETVEFKSAYETVEGVGDMAYWSAKQNQLSVAAGNRVFHLGVKAKDEAKNLELAKALARAVIEKGFTGR